MNVVASTTDEWTHNFTVLSGRAMMVTLVGTISASTVTIRQVASDGSLSAPENGNFTSSIGVRMIIGAGNWRVTKTGADDLGLDRQEMSYGGGGPPRLRTGGAP